MRIAVDNERGWFRWRLVRRTPFGADVLARSARCHPDERSCHAAVDRLAEAPADTMLVVQQPNGQWRWVVAAPDGYPLAESPAMFRDAAECNRALADLRREIASLGVG